MILVEYYQHNNWNFVFILFFMLYGIFINGNVYNAKIVHLTRSVRYRFVEAFWACAERETPKVLAPTF